MSTKSNKRVIAIEEHYFDPELSATFKGNNPPLIQERILDVGEARLKGMDDAGVDVQVLSHGAPSTQRLDPENAVRLATLVNDRLQETILGNPDRYQGFAALPTPDPKAAADELERCVTKYGFKGAMVHGLTNGEFLDEQKFWPIFERAAALDVPLYMHPAIPHPEVTKAYYATYLEQYPALLTAGWGFTVETATQGIRIVLSGVLDKYPNLKIILGHLGESLPFSLWRIDQALSRPGNKSSSSFRDAFCEHFWITTSGNFSNPALLCCVMEMGIDRILFSIDYPFVENEPGVDWVENDVPLCQEDRIKILSGNAEKLLKM